MKPNILIRADGNHQIGLGHLIRCIALSQMLKEDFKITFISKSIPESIVNELTTYEFRCVKINKEQDFFDLITRESIVILDGYTFDSDFQKNIKANGAKLVCIDDLHDKEFVADLIINHTPGITPHDYIAQPYTQFALGHEYTLLRPVFLEQSQNQRDVIKIETVMICFGGSDNKNLTQQSLQIVQELQYIRKINVITGHAYLETDSFKKSKSTDDRITHFQNIDGAKMHAVMMESDLAIVPASGILLEAICCSCVPLMCFYTENQKRFHSYMNSENQINSFGDNSVIFQSNDLKKKLQCNNLIGNPAPGKIRKSIINSSSKLIKLFHNLND